MDEPYFGAEQHMVWWVLEEHGTTDGFVDSKGTGTHVCIADLITKMFSFKGNNNFSTYFPFLFLSFCGELADCSYISFKLYIPAASSAHQRFCSDTAKQSLSSCTVLQTKPLWFGWAWRRAMQHHLSSWPGVCCWLCASFGKISSYEHGESCAGAGSTEHSGWRGLCRALCCVWCRAVSAAISVLVGGEQHAADGSAGRAAPREGLEG